MWSFIKRLWTKRIGDNYHDVVVFVDGKRYPLSKATYGLQLQCCRVSGWQLWFSWKSTNRLIGGEYDSEDFRVEVNGFVICQSKGNGKLQDKLTKQQ